MRQSPLARGFTLIELLVVIAIIGLLASLVLASLTTIQARSRDTRRLADMQTVMKALQLHVTAGGIYPIAASTTLTGTDVISAALIADGSLTNMPHDPLSPNPSYVYRYASLDGLRYVLSFCLESASIRGYTQGCNNFISP